MKKYIILTLLMTLLTKAPLMAQQEAMYSQYMFNSLAINPAYAGSRGLTSITALHRSQWIGIAGAPTTTTITVDAPINDKKIGLGFQAFNDKIGIANTTGAFASYAYRLPLEESSLSFGLQVGVNSYRADFASVPLNSEGISYDGAFGENINKLLLNFGTGVYYSSDRFYVGLSAPQLLNNKLSNFSVKTGNVFSGQTMHLFLASAYVFPIGQDFHLKPSFLIKVVKGAPIEADINATLWIKDRLAFGLQYRTNADIAAMLEVQATPQIRIGYAYDRSVTKLVKFNSGSHEVMLRYEFGFEKGKILSPRYF